MDSSVLYKALKEADEFRIQAHIDAEEAYQRKWREAFEAWHLEDMLKDNPISDKSKEPGT